MVESGPAVMTKATSKASATASASRLCARLGGKFERTKCCSSSTAAAGFAIGTPPAGAGAHGPILFRVAAVHTPLAPHSPPLSPLHPLPPPHHPPRSQTHPP